MPSIQEIRQKYPQYEDMTDEQLAQALHKKFYSDMEFSDFAQRIGMVPKVDETESKRGMLDELGRQLGLTGRYIVEGATAIPAMAADALKVVGSVGLNPMRAGDPTVLAGLQSQPSTSGVISGMLDEAGLPRPEGSFERVVGDASRALAATGASAGAGAIPVARELAALPLRQAAGAVAGAGGAGVTRESGGGPGAQLAAGLASGVLASNPELIARGAAAATRVIPAMMRPMTQGGREQIVGTLLRDQADDASRALTNLQNADEIVPGSVPTTGAAARDAGLLALEKGARARRPGEFGARLSEQNAARQQLLDDIAGTPADIVDDVAAREAATTSARESAFASARQAATQKILDKADEILASPAGARKPVQQAVAEFRTAIEGETDPARLYAIRQDIGDAMAGKFGGEKASFALARKELIALRETLDDVIDDAAPGFKAYLERYRELSKPINQKEALQELQARSTLAAPDITTGRDFLSQAKFSRNLDKLLQDRLVAQNLTAEQVKTAKAIAADLDLGASINSSLIKAPGSDTFQNYSLAGVIGAARMRSGELPPFLKTFLKPLDFVYRASDERIDDLLTQAMLDPKLAAMLMAKPTKASVNLAAAALKRDAIRAYGQGAVLGAATASQEREPQRQDTR